MKRQTTITAVDRRQFLIGGSIAAASIPTLLLPLVSGALADEAARPAVILCSDCFASHIGNRMSKTYPDSLFVTIGRDPVRDWKTRLRRCIANAAPAACILDWSDFVLMQGLAFEAGFAVSSSEPVKFLSASSRRAVRKGVFCRIG